MLKVDQNTVEARPATEARLRPSDFGQEAIDRGLENLGQGIAETAKNVDQIDQMYDEAAVKQADADDLKQIMTIKANALQATGFDAQTAVKDAREKIMEIRKQRMTTLKGRQQRMYADVFDQRNLQVEESFSNHLAKQITEANKSAASARAETYSDDAINSYGTPEFDKSLATAESEVATVNKGAGNDVIGLAQAKLRSKVYSGVVEGLISDPNKVGEAKAVLDKHAGDILPEDETQLRKKLNPLIEEDQTESDAGWSFTNSPVSGEPSEPDPTKGEPYYTGETADTPPRPSITGPSSRHAPVQKPVSPTDPLRGKGTLTNTAAQHRARGSGNALDIAAPTGTPIYPPMSGKVIKNWWSKEGGWSVLVEHPNGYVTGYAHMRAQSALKEGAAVDSDTVIGGVGMTGSHATGPHVHYTVRQSKAGPKVDPDAVNWGDTVKPDSVSWKEGPLIRYEADENSTGRALQRLHDRATAENWSPRRYNNAVARVRQIGGIQNELYNQQQDDRWNEALSTVVALDDKLTSVSQIPNFGLLDPGHQLTIKNIIKSNLNPSEEGKADGPVYLDLTEMALNPARREQFIGRKVGNRWVGGVDLLQEGRITRGERAQLFKQQLELRNDSDGKLAGSLDQAYTAANRYLPASGNGKIFSANTRDKFARRYTEVVAQRQAQLQRPLTDREADDVARGLVTDVVSRDNATGEQKGSGKLFEYDHNVRPGEHLTTDVWKVWDSIPPDTRNQIIADRQRKGLSYSYRDVVNAYLQMSR